jgi:hypothetical protein
VEALETEAFSLFCSWVCLLSLASAQIVEGHRMFGAMCSPWVCLLSPALAQIVEGHRMFGASLVDFDLPCFLLTVADGMGRLWQTTVCG